jgi:hypothetical protein
MWGLIFTPVELWIARDTRAGSAWRWSALPSGEKLSGAGHYGDHKGTDEKLTARIVRNPRFELHLPTPCAIWIKRFRRSMPFD